MKLGDIEADESSFAYRDLLDKDVWNTFTPVFPALTVVGATSYSGRYRFVGRQGFFQVKFSAATSIASVAGTSYMNLPFTAKGLSGSAVMTDVTTNIAVGVCHADIANSRIYLPTRTASGDVFNISGWTEV